MDMILDKCIFHNTFLCFQIDMLLVQCELLHRDNFNVHLQHMSIK